MKQKQKQGAALENPQGKPAPEGTNSPKGGSSLYSSGSKSVAAESTFDEQKRDKDGNVVTEKKKK